MNIFNKIFLHLIFIYLFLAINCNAQQLQINKTCNRDFNYQQIFKSNICSSNFFQLTDITDRYLIANYNELKTGNTDYLKCSVKKNLQGIYFINQDSLKKRKSVKLENMGLEFLVGTGMGLGFGMFGAFIGSFGHIVGDTSSSGSEGVARVQLILIYIGHAIGSIAGVAMETEKLDGYGSNSAALSGAVLGEAVSLFAFLKNKNTSSGCIYLVCSSLLGTLGYNIFRKSDSKDDSNSSLINYKKEKLFFSSPGIFFTNDKMNCICTNFNLLELKF